MNQDGRVVYTGVTTRSINQRFGEHIWSKDLDRKKYSIKEINIIEHPKITTLTELIQERQKVFKLENYYIKKYSQNNTLLNLSNGGEWGSYLYKVISKQDFLNKYGSLDGFKQYLQNRRKFKAWLNHWTDNSRRNKFRLWLMNWIDTVTMCPAKYWIRKWIWQATTHPTKIWFRHWIDTATKNPAKLWLHNWITHSSELKVKRWMKSWILHRSINPA